ncbi:GAF domain-containing protein [Streptomyces armeniacus]|uniref:GAF domain-containing protein n=1 Tax=Streptomyces armeniacus TaxID=83291 RepID=A0A345XJA9_9ACTN|nr:SpoIIE family protein phosphatase [Streptomyces armeniacus]AXK31725.1 GAF domain-containing protein [Streptomyces armeniacus]
MRTEDVLTAVGTGVWRWENTSGTVTLDARAARLLGLAERVSAGGTVTLSEAAARSRIHVADFLELQSIATLAVTEHTPAEALVRVVTPDGGVVRTVRLRMRAVGTGRVAPGAGAELPLGENVPFHVIGLMSEVPEPPPSSPSTPAGAAQTQVTGDWRRSREAFLLDAGRALAEARSTAEVLRVAGGLSMPGFTPDGLAVFGVEGDRLSVIGHHGHAPGDEGPFLDMPLETDYPAAQVVRTGRAVYLPTPDDYRRRFPTTWPLAASFGRQSWAFLPLTVAGRTIGAWLAAFSHPVAFTPDERSVLSTVARMLAQALERAYLHENERELADGLQRALRPAEKPRMEGMEIAARYVPTGGGLQVGGDWYDVIPLPSDRTAIVVGDVQGHDVRAAGIMSQLRIALRAYAAEGHRPDAVLSRASRFLSGLNRADSADTDADGGPDTGPDAGPDADARFATCLYMEVDPRTGRLDIARAGHPDPAVRMPDGTVLLRPTEGGLPLGIDPDSCYPTSQLLLQPGETLLACTDGLLETGGHDLESGWERLREVCAAHLDEVQVRFRGQEPDQGPDGQDQGPEGAGDTESGGMDGSGTGGGGTGGRGRLEALADALVQAVHGPSSHHRTGPLADRREDDIALLLLRRKSDGAGGGAYDGAARTPVRRTVLTVAQAQPDRIAGARHQLEYLMHDWKDEGQTHGAVLMLSEMLTNVLVHTDGNALAVAEISGERGARLLRVEVADHSDELPHLRSPGEMASSGRGLMLMESLAGAWGVDPRGDGKCIWFEVREDESAE